ncbi:MAG TPA: DUF3826 domain-containing protein [Verrucomicrobiae bacterium]
MKKQMLAASAILIAVIGFTRTASAQMSTPAATDAEKETFYATTIENRVVDILKVLNLSDAAKSNAVHEILVAQYHDLRVRDAAIDTRLKVDGKEVNYANRAPLLAAQAQPQHDQFLAKLAENLTPEQVEQVKDLMTYHKVKVTYDAYCVIISGLTDAEKAKILELLKAAREEAIDGGNSPEKSAIFQKYKNQINAYLDAQGHDTAKAFQDWIAKNPNTNNPAAK